VKRARLVFAVLATFLGGCAGTQLEHDLRGVRQLTEEARTKGAYRCAPKELALAETSAIFSEHELAQGDYFHAHEHLVRADENARVALQIAEQPACHPPQAPGDADGDGIKDDVDRCPKDPEDKDGFEDQDGCPDPDNDKDGIADRSDKCPDEPEDKDGFEDEDGCPDLDNDKDGIADADDRCTDQPEDKDGFEDQDGCPDPDNDKDGVPDIEDRCPDQAGIPENAGCPKVYEHIVVRDDKIELKQKIFFSTNKSVILPQSYALLGEIANVLQTRPGVQIRIEGHTDSRGKRASNLALSQARAESVRQYLVGLGIDASRLEAIGFGPDQPIETNKTAAGREKNRRVEFFIKGR